MYNALHPLLAATGIKAARNKKLHVRTNFLLSYYLQPLNDLETVSIQQTLNLEKKKDMRHSTELMIEVKYILTHLHVLR